MVIGFVLLLMLLTLWGWYLKTNHVEVFEAGGSQEKKESQNGLDAAGREGGYQAVSAMIAAKVPSERSKGIEADPIMDNEGRSAEISGKININTAGVEEFVTLNGIGEVKAREIVAYREQHGAFERIEQIQDVKGIGESTFNKIKDRITVGTE